MYRSRKLAAIIPAYNEATIIGTVVRQLVEISDDEGQALFEQVIVCDNNSTDQTGAIAREAGALVIRETEQGYGAACLAGMAGLDNPDIVVFIDGDGSVRADEVFLLLDTLTQGADLAIGSRYTGHEEAGALSVHQKLGTRWACTLISKLWQQPVSDLGPFRAICFHALQKLQMRDRAFGWTVEMQVKAIQAGLRVTEVPITSLRRQGRSKISGTLRGTIGAALGIFGTIGKLWAQEKILPQTSPASST